MKLTGLRVGPRIDLAPDLTDYVETAGAVAALDLVISVDTSVCHLVGGLAKPIWVPLPWVTDWRWLLGREDNPWYPSMRLYRQPAIGDWDTPLARLRQELAAVAGRPTRPA